MVGSKQSSAREGSPRSIASGVNDLDVGKKRKKSKAAMRTKILMGSAGTGCRMGRVDGGEVSKVRYLA